jgi:NADH dehydrogenase FAD-containing subunit
MGGLRRTMLKELAKHNVEMIINARVEEILPDRVVIRTESGVLTYEANTVVLAAGYRSRGTAMIDWLEKNLKYQYCVIGDAEKVGNIGKALQDAYNHCR